MSTKAELIVRFPTTTAIIVVVVVVVVVVVEVMIT